MSQNFHINQLMEIPHTEEINKASFIIQRSGGAYIESLGEEVTQLNNFIRKAKNNSTKLKSS